MNNLFKNGDYVLLSDCRAFDVKHGLTPNHTEKLVAEKMNGGSVKASYLEYTMSTEDCVGVYGKKVGLWSVDDMLTNRLSVEDTLYRSENGLTIAELREIPGALEDGKKYVCTSANLFYFNAEQVYTANNNKLNGKANGGQSLFKPIKTTNGSIPINPWQPMIGETVNTESGEAKIELILDDEVCVSNKHGLSIARISELSQVDEKRKAAIKKSVELLNETFGVDTVHDSICEKLYDAGVLKC